MRLSQGKCLQRIDTVQFHNNCAAVSAEAKFFGIGAATTEVKVQIPEIRTVPPEIRTLNSRKMLFLAIGAATSGRSRSGRSRLARVT